MLQLGPQDSQFLYMETDDNLSNVSMLCLYEQTERQTKGGLLALLRAHIESRLHTSPIFRRRLKRVPLDLDHPYWVEDEHFELDYHLYHHQLEAPASWSQLMALLGIIHSRPLDMRRPVWEIHLVEGLDDVPGLPASGFALIAKLHHAAVDGSSMMKFFAGLCDVDAEGTPAVDLGLTAASAGSSSSGNQVWKRALANTLRAPLNLTQSLAKSAPGLIASLSNRRAQDKPADQPAPIPTTRLNQPVLPGKCADGVEFSLADFKRVQAAVEPAKINDVVLAVVSGGVRRYLDSCGELPDSPLHAWVPINVRSAGKSASEEGNRVSAMTVNLHTTLVDPVARLREITSHTRAAKAGAGSSVAGLVTEFSQLLPGAMVSLLSRAIATSGVTSRLCNLAVSNVPAGNQPLYLAGHRCQSVYGMVPLATGMGLFVVAISYNNRLTLTLTSTPEIIPDTDYFCQCLRAAFNELQDAVGVGAAKTRKR
ncbi:MAG: wax ester/triacylglycerol synthase family O-acyltransferase [Gammaproteobacteria bacterium]|nr:wax ester/triacylglycerol synthase family O-acyltransferase [Gammaproteobacteria bacterium]